MAQPAATTKLHNTTIRSDSLMFITVVDSVIASYAGLSIQLKIDPRPLKALACFLSKTGFLGISKEIVTGGTSIALSFTSLNIIAVGLVA